MLAIINTVKESGNAVISDSSALAYDLLMQLDKQINIKAENVRRTEVFAACPCYCIY